MTPHQTIIRERFSGISGLAEAYSKHLGRRLPKSTVQGWDESGLIPSKYHDDILELGAVLSPPLQPQEFFRAQEDAA